jgi:hypothetical protein
LKGDKLIKKWLLPLVLAIVLVFTLLPVSYLNANPGKLVINGDFSNGLTNWDTGNATIDNGAALLTGNRVGWVDQYIYNIPSAISKNLVLSFDVKPTVYNSGGYISVGFKLAKNSIRYSRWAAYDYYTLPLNQWTHKSFKLSDAWLANTGNNIPDFDEVFMWLKGEDCNEYFDNIILDVPETAPAPYVAPVWVRTGPMVCRNVWVNTKGNFQFVFWYPYKDNNWVKIYDISGKEIFSIDMPVDNPQFEVSLPDGMYTVKTFTVGSSEPIQTFTIGKDASTPRQDLGELSQ